MGQRILLNRNLFQNGNYTTSKNVTLRQTLKIME